MWQDPIVQATRLLREEYATQFNHDADAIFADISKRQSQKKVVSFSARRPSLKELLLSDENRGDLILPTRCRQNQYTEPQTHCLKLSD